VGDWPLRDAYAGLAVEMDSGPARCEYGSAVRSLLDPGGGSLSFIADDCLEEAMSSSGSRRCTTRIRAEALVNSFVVGGVSPLLIDR
jgi:hypothetical protein